MASGRLKRRLEEVDHSDINFSESFVVYGTSLPSLTESGKKDKNEFVPVWQQEVRDEKGRRRLHGAFTGGFSAGYFNTVGSKEGWAPSTFKSSRQNKTSFQQNVEDFMDEEDLDERKQAQGQRIKTAEAYDPLMGNSSQQVAPSKFESLIKPSSERIGEKLLTRMGWRQGQGIGPRISWAARKAQAEKLGYPLDKKDIDDDEERKKHLWPPLDQPLVLFKQKNDNEGLGFARRDRLDAKYQSTQTAIKERQQAKKYPVGGAFGIGAMEDADDDDMDIYQPTEQSDIRKHYSFHENDNTETSTISHSDKPISHFKSRSKDVQDIFNDGSPVITGFRLSIKIQEPPKWFESQKLPNDWEPDPNRVFKLAIQIKKPDSTEGKANEQALNSDKRREILGEEDIKGPRRSVFEYISAKDKERMELARSSFKSPQSSGSGGIVIPSLNAEAAKAALKGFVPYAEDAVKQNRYRLYLLSQIEGADSEAAAQLRPPEKMTIAEFNSELERFAEAARMFSPLSFSMAKRFQRSTGTSNEPQIEPGLTIPDPNKTEEQANVKEEEKPKKSTNASPAAKAAQMDQFGVLTRTTVSFYPARLVCKRFNVPDPWPSGPPPADPLEHTFEVASMGTTKEVLADDTMNAILQDGDSKPFSKELPATSNEGNNGGSSKSKGDLSTVGLGEDDRQGKDVLTYERPAMDIFEAIFANSDDDEEEQGQDQDQGAENNDTKNNDNSTNDNGTITGPAEEEKSQEFQDPFPPKPTDIQKSDEPVDTNSFKPKFALRREKPAKREAEESKEDKVKRKKKKKEKTSKSKMSFALDEDGEGEDNRKSSSNPTKKHREKRDRDIQEPDDAQEEFEWAEKRTSAIPATSHRARASDFL